MKERWQAEYSEWEQHQIENEIVYLWLDGVYLKAGLAKEKAALLMAIGVKERPHGGAGGEQRAPGVDSVVERPAARSEGARDE